MKHISIPFFIATSILYSLSANAQDFRKVSWGMTKPEVKKSEVLEILDEGESHVIYKTILAGKEVYLGYLFSKGKLIKARYILTDSYLNYMQYYLDYQMLNRILERKYGEPIKDTAIWQGDPYYKNDTSSWGDAIHNSELSLFTLYDSERTAITSYISAEDYDVANIIEYQTKMKNF